MLKFTLKITMAILQSCCCWRSVRKGSFACGFYTMLYFIANAVITSIHLHEELRHLRSNFTEPPPRSILDPETISETSLIFTFILLCTTSTGILSCAILFYGLYKNNRAMLIPWIINVLVFTMADLAHCTFLFFEHALKFNPSNAIFLTLEFFIISLNVYALLCVISQYQELKAGRGRALDDQNNRVPNIHYSAQPTATSYLSTKRAVTYQETRPTPTQSPTGTGPHTSLGTDEASPNSRNPRKSVKFPDNASPARNGSQLLEPWTIDMKSPMLIVKGADTAPLIESSVEPTQPNV